jgi:hypothetical protein
MNTGKMFSIKKTTAMPTEAEIPLSHCCVEDLPITNKNDFYVVTRWEALRYYIERSFCRLIRRPERLIGKLKVIH